MSKEVWKETESYTIYVQYIEDELHVHCDVDKWTPSALKALYRELARLKDWAKGMGYEEMFSISPNPKFCEMLCAKSLGTFRNYEVMKWDLN